MSVGSSVRQLLGPRFDAVAATAYRRAFVDLDVLAHVIAASGRPRSVLEVGCGEGALLSRVVDALEPGATALGIDVAGQPGHRYTGGSPEVEFRLTTASEVFAEGRRFDLVVLADVLHHVPIAERHDLVATCRDLAHPGGVVVVKEWVRRRNAAHLAAFTSDYVISGDRSVRFADDSELRELVRGVFDQDATLALEEVVIPPHRNNVAHVARLR
jgi:2-polyprenyl-3-methyl-5-hydroxy-6-metoxy-1,4-benzoquinol methylase